MGWIAEQTAENIYQQLAIRDLRAAAGSLRISRDQLLHSRNVLRALFDSFPDGLYIIDSQFQLTAVNMPARPAHRTPPQSAGGWVLLPDAIREAGSLSRMPCFGYIAEGGDVYSNTTG